MAIAKIIAAVYTIFIIFGGALSVYAAEIELIETQELPVSAMSFIGNSATSLELGLPFTPTLSGNILTDGVDVSLAVGTGAPTDGIYIEIRTDDSGLPSSTVLATSTLEYPAGGCGDISFNLSNSVAVDGSTQYWIYISRGGSYDGSNYYRICGDDADDPVDTVRWNGTSWASIGANWRALISIHDSEEDPEPEPEPEPETDPTALTGTEQLFIWSIVIFALMFPVWDVCFRPIRRLYDNKKGI